MAYRIILRRDTSINWEKNNPVLLLGEPGYETDTGNLKIGDGNSKWNDLNSYYTMGGPGSNNLYGDQRISQNGITIGTLILSNYENLGFDSDSSAELAGVPLGGIYHDINNPGNLKIRLI